MGEGHADLAFLDGVPDVREHIRQKLEHAYDALLKFENKITILAKHNILPLGRERYAGATTSMDTYQCK